MRFYVRPEFIVRESHIIDIRDKSEIHHIRDVMRLKKGINVNVFDGKGIEYCGNIVDINNKQVLIRIDKTLTSKDVTPFEVTLYQAVPKKNKMDYIIEKAVELGVACVVPIITDRTIVRIKDSQEKKIERWHKIGINASKQCGRDKLPIISDIISFDSAVEKAKDNDLVIVAALDDNNEPLKTILKNSSPNHTAVFIGPEGDFSREEISRARQSGYKIVSLGPLVLKSDTAAIHVLSSLLYEYR